MKKTSILWAVTVVLVILGSQVVQASDLLASSDSRLPTTQAVSGFELKVSSTDATSVQLQWQPQSGASEYEVSRDGRIVGATIATIGYFTDFDLRPGESYRYIVTAYNAFHAVMAQSAPVSARTTKSTTIRTHYNVLAIAFNPEQASLLTEETYLKHRIG